MTTTDPLPVRVLARVTTRYGELEDRIRLAGETDSGETVVLWLTQRLSNRLVSHLCQWLEQRIGTTPLAEVKQEFAQQEARAKLEPQQPVRADADAQGVLVQRVNLKSTRARVTLQFKDRDGKVVATLQLQPKPLRQWLCILHDQYQRAQWPTAVWPAWVADVTPPRWLGRAAVLH